MSKRLRVQPSKSQFTEILARHGEASAPAAMVDERKRGKSADPGYVKLTAYIRKTTHNAVKIRLLQEAQDRDFSELVELLLQGWLKEDSHG
jgi:hypothetical protein